MTSNPAREVLGAASTLESGFELAASELVAEEGDIAMVTVPGNGCRLA